MGNLILCHDRRASHPYEITRIHCRVYTIEELCYYLCNNLYLIDYTIMNEQLCSWLQEELGMDRLASDLRDILRLRGSVEKFVITILKASRIYREPEMIRIQNVLEHLKNQKDIERQKYKGDNLLESGEVEEAILVYQAILNGEKDETVDDKFYGSVYAGLGAAYGRRPGIKTLSCRICMRPTNICPLRNTTSLSPSRMNIWKQTPGCGGRSTISKRRFRMNRARTVLINGSASTAGAIRKASAGTGSRIYALCQNRLKQLRFDRGIFM